MKVSIIIPAHNEEAIIEKTVKKVYSVMKKTKYDYEIVCVDDNSNDKTGQILEKLSKTVNQIKVMHKKEQTRGPTGLGSALIFGFKHSLGNVLIPFMGDLSDNPNDILKLIEKIDEGYDVVCGSRFVRGGKIKDYPLVKLIANRIWNRLFAFLFGLEIRDISNGFKAYRKDVINKTKPKSKGFEITAEIVLKARIQGFRITEVPVNWRGRKKDEGLSKFGSFSLIFILTKLPVIAYAYVVLAFKIWLGFLAKKIKKDFNFNQRIE
jgi:hypothetical protein